MEATPTAAEERAKRAATQAFSCSAKALDVIEDYGRNDMAEYVRKERPSPSSTCAPIHHTDNPGDSTKDKERTFKSLCGHLTSLNSIAHKGTLTDEQLIKFEDRTRVLCEELTNMEKSANETQGAQVGKERKRKVDTQGGGKLFKKTTPSETELRRMPK